MDIDNMDIFERMLVGGVIKNDDPQMSKVWQVVSQTIKLSASAQHLFIH